MPDNKKIHNFYINEEQSIYLLSHTDAKKHKQWLKICIKQLELLGYKDVEEIGSGAFGFVFSGTGDISKVKCKGGKRTIYSLPGDGYLGGLTIYNAFPKDSSN